MHPPHADVAMISRFTVLTAIFVIGAQAHARGVSPYLPLNLSPEMDQRIERLMILADKPVLTRPLAAAAVLDALPAACEQDPVLCEQVRRYLAGFMKTAGIAHASLTATAGSDKPIALPNRHGMTADSGYEASFQAYWQPSDYMLINAGVLAYEDETIPTGSMLSIGREYVQVDVGFRGHWLSPMTDSAMLIGTQAQSMPSITVSNYTPLTRFGLRYEFFIAEMSESNQIRYQDGFTAGNPQLAGMHLSIEPVSGWSLGFNRLMQYGGGDRPDSFSDLMDAFFDPAKFDNKVDGQEFGNQLASITSTWLMPGPLPAAVYFEYAGEDTSASSNYHLGNVALSGGVHFPTLWQKYDLTLEVSEWQNGWYVHGIYQDGLRHEGHVIGHWGGDWRELNDGVGAMSFMARVAWEPRFSGLLEITGRTLDNESYTAPNYERAYTLDVRYSRSWQDFFVGAEINLGRDVFGTSYSRVSGFIRF